MYRHYYGSDIPIAPVGGIELTDWRLCWQAHDDYFECVDKQVSKGGKDMLK